MAIVSESRSKRINQGSAGRVGKPANGWIDDERRRSSPARLWSSVSTRPFLPRHARAERRFSRVRAWSACWRTRSPRTPQGPDTSGVMGRVEAAPGRVGGSQEYLIRPTKAKALFDLAGGLTGGPEDIFKQGRLARSWPALRSLLMSARMQRWSGCCRDDLVERFREARRGNTTCRQHQHGEVLPGAAGLQQRTDRGGVARIVRGLDRGAASRSFDLLMKRPHRRCPMPKCTGSSARLPGPSHCLLRGTSWYWIGAKQQGTRAGVPGRVEETLDQL